MKYLDGAHGKAPVPKGCRLSAILLRGRPNSKSRNCLTVNENGIISRHATPLPDGATHRSKFVLDPANPFIRWRLTASQPPAPRHAFLEARW
jgi:hypothetical protein